MEVIKWMESAAFASGGVFFFGGLLMQPLLSAISFIKSRVFGGSPEFNWLPLNWSEVRGWRGAALYPMVVGILLLMVGIVLWLLRQLIHFLGGIVS